MNLGQIGKTFWYRLERRPTGTKEVARLHQCGSLKGTGCFFPTGTNGVQRHRLKYPVSLDQSRWSWFRGIGCKTSIYGSSQSALKARFLVVYVYTFHTCNLCVLIFLQFFISIDSRLQNSYQVDGISSSCTFRQYSLIYILCIVVETLC